MADITPEQAKALLEAGHISQATHDAIVGADAGSMNEPAEPQAEAASDAPLDPRIKSPMAVPESQRKGFFQSLGFGSVAPDNPEPDAPAPVKPEVSSGDEPTSSPAAAGPRAPGSTETPSSAPAPAGSLPGDAQAHQPGQDYFRQQMADAIGKQQQGYDMQQQAAVEGGAAGVKAAAAQTSFLRKTAADMDQMQQDAQTHEAIRQQQWDEASKRFDDALSEKVDTHRLWANASTGQKISTVVGLFLGAFGSDGNGAVKVINDAINRDIDAQKANMEKNLHGQTTLLGMMRDKFTDQRQAEAAARAFAIDKAQNQVKLMESQTQNTMAKANAQMLYGKLEIEKQNAKMEALKAYQATGAIADSSGDTARVINGARALGIKTEDALEDYQKYQHHEDTIKQIDKAFTDSARLRTLSNYAKSPIQARRQAEAIEAGMIPILGEAYKRFTEAEKETFKKNMPEAGDSAETTALKRKVITDLMRNKIPEYKTGLINTLKIGPKKLSTLGAPT